MNCLFLLSLFGLPLFNILTLYSVKLPLFLTQMSYRYHNLLMIWDIYGISMGHLWDIYGTSVSSCR